MQWRLGLRGYTCLGLDGPGGWDRSAAEPQAKYDVISCLNVLDRCDRPRTMLRQLRDSVKPDTGRVVIVVVLPFGPSVEAGAGWRPPLETLPIRGSSAAEHARSFSEDVFGPMGLVVTAVSKAPYLCEGDMVKPYYLLNDYVFCLSPGGTPSQHEL